MLGNERMVIAAAVCFLAIFAGHSSIAQEGGESRGYQEGFSMAQIATSYFEKGEGQPIILIHGWGDSKETWRACADILSARFHVYAYDLLGFGKSTYPLGAFTIEAFVGQLERFIEDRKIACPILVGNSMGAQIALKYAVDYPHEGSKPPDIAGLVLVDISGGSKTTEAFVATSSKLAGCANALHGVWEEKETRSAVHAALLEVMFNDDAVTPALEERLIDQFRTPQGRQAMLWTAKQFRYDQTSSFSGFAFVRGRNPIRTDASGKVVAPMLVLWGAQDPWFPAESVKEIDGSMARYKAYKSRIIEGCGHLPQIEKPAEVCNAIMDTFAPESGKKD